MKSSAARTAKIDRGAVLAGRLGRFPSIQRRPSSEVPQPGNSAGAKPRPRALHEFLGQLVAAVQDGRYDYTREPGPLRGGALMSAQAYLRGHLQSQP